MLASVSTSACMPAPPDGSEAANVRTIGGIADSASSGIAFALASCARSARLRSDLLELRDFTPIAKALRLDEEVHVPHLRLDLRRGTRCSRRRHCARNEMGRRAAQLEL